jgi:hypothetical protein
VGAAVLRPHDRWGKEESNSYVLDLYIHPNFQGATDALLKSILPDEGHVQVFLDGASEDKILFFLERGFTLETSLKGDFNHHDDSTPDIRIYSKLM